jgi:transposase
MPKHSKRNSEPIPKLQTLNQLNKQEQEKKQWMKSLPTKWHGLKNPSGRQYSFEENRVLLCILLGFMTKKGLTEAAAIKSVVTLTGADWYTISYLYSHFKSTGEIVLPDTSRMGSGNPRHSRYLGPFTLDQEREIHRIIEELNQIKGFCNTADIQSLLKSNFNIEITRNCLQRRLHSLGYQWGRSRTIGGMTRAARIARGVIYMKELSLAIQEEKQGNVVIVYTDESYVNVKHKIQYTWYSIYSPHTNEVGGPSGKGEREIIIHAITKYGLIGGNENPNSDLSKQLEKGKESAQYFFLGAYIGEDYHKNMDDKFFISWLSNRFIPAFSAKFPDKKCILILDNAGYHHAVGEGYIKLGGTKKELIEKLKSLGVESIEVERGGRKTKMNSSSWIHRKSNFAPSTVELSEALKLELVKHPDRQRTEMKRLFDEKGWQLIYTPPYTPEVQPIEKVWAYIKHFIASLFTPHRTASILLTNTILAFYGDPPSLHPGVTPELCSSLIDHSNAWCNQFIHHHIKENGDLQSLANWLNENPQEEAIEDENQDIQDGAIEEEEKEQFDIFAFPNDEEVNYL